MDKTFINSKSIKYKDTPHDTEHMLHFLKYIHDFIEKYGNNILKEHGLTLAQCHALSFLVEAEGHKSTMKELEKSMNVAQSTSAGVVYRLEKKGFIKTYVDSNDKRVKIIELCEDAEDLLSIIRESMKCVQDKILENLTDIEKILFISLLKKITDDLN